MKNKKIETIQQLRNPEIEKFVNEVVFSRNTLQI